MKKNSMKAFEKKFLENKNNQSVPEIDEEEKMFLFSLELNLIF